MKFDSLTKQAVIHTRHCLIGCGIGEIAGMALGSAWSNFWQTTISIVLAFFFGYLLTFLGAKRMGSNPKAAAKTALATDTVSITSMEIVDNLTIWLIPSAINATLSNGLFWWSLASSLAVAFVITVPVNRLVISRSGHHHH